MKNIIVFTVLILSVATSMTFAENIDPYNTANQYAWSENTGWLNFDPIAGPGVHVYHDRIEGFLWAENIGWINLSPATYGGVENDGLGNLSGYAWAENVGWINFKPQVPGSRIDYGVKIDEDGNFSGYAWGENIGWINFNLEANYVQTCVVTIDDLANFVSYWMASSDTPADLDNDNKTTIADFAILANYWLDYCPDDWQLK
ncbi:MAG: hypothetical protein JEZ07_18140 [Phycisphaerae bacterium]|nr:hypothetical protein [Phycisphaerae bacterium]